MSTHRDCYWGEGHNSAHCQRCCRSFSSVAHFDKHQPGSGRQCVDITTQTHPERLKKGGPHPYAGKPIYRVATRGGETRKDGTVTRTYQLVTRIAWERFEGEGE